jgi:hypothetical protein
MFSPDAARPAKRVYIGNLPPEMSQELVDIDLRNAINELMAQIGGVMGEGPAVTSCKLYPVSILINKTTFSPSKLMPKNRFIFIFIVFKT